MLAAASAPAIEFVDVVREFGPNTGPHRVLDHVSFVAPAGAVTVLLGPSGAGKTVTIEHVVGLLRPRSGEIRVGGYDLVRASEEQVNELRSSMGVVLQGALPFTCGLFSTLNVYENVAGALRIHYPHRSEAWVHERTVRCLRLVGLLERAGEMPSVLSAGTSKLLATARAITLEPTLLVVDDFDSGLDPVRLSQLCELVYRAHLETGATVLISTHDLGAARKLADHLVLIEHGRILASGDADELFASDDPVIARLTCGRIDSSAAMDVVPRPAPARLADVPTSWHGWA